MRDATGPVRLAIRLGVRTHFTVSEKDSQVGKPSCNACRKLSIGLQLMFASTAHALCESRPRFNDVRTFAFRTSTALKWMLQWTPQWSAAADWRSKGFSEGPTRASPRSRVLTSWRASSTAGHRALRLGHDAPSAISSKGCTLTARRV